MVETWKTQEVLRKLRLGLGTHTQVVSASQAIALPPRFHCTSDSRFQQQKANEISSRATVLARVFERVARVMLICKRCRAH